MDRQISHAPRMGSIVPSDWGANLIFENSGNIELVSEGPTLSRQFVERVFGCSGEVASAVVRHARPSVYPAHRTIIAQGHLGSETLLLVTGRAHAFIYRADGRSMLLHEFSSGDLFGALLDHGAGSDCEVTAVEDVAAAVFLGPDFLRLVEAHASLGLALSRMLLKRLQQSSSRLADRVTLSAPGRVYAELLRLAQAGDGATIRPAPVLSTLAVHVQSTRETVSRTINALERRGLIRRDADALVIVAPRRLEMMVI